MIKCYLQTYEFISFLTKRKKVKNMLFNTFCNYIFCKVQDIHYTLANYYLICIVF